ncbi:hypothetical protein CK203_038782 [Vitis vinifera]|uniref:Uncharacterized protein n=1 Tax=Vitis vinifera TaxID=29760 RepID=A0A438I1R2_VITVI|nr:hypothetical protein CK203_038782 [Vitis vinifera]
MTSLRFLDLSFNGFTSDIPLWLYHIPAIERLDLSVNNFQGKVPSGIENLTSLTRLDLSDDALEGEILPSWEVFAISNF